MPLLTLMPLIVYCQPLPEAIFYSYLIHTPPFFRHYAPADLADIFHTPPPMMYAFTPPLLSADATFSPPLATPRHYAFDTLVTPLLPLCHLMFTLSDIFELYFR